jgi:hypothetical protein
LFNKWTGIKIETWYLCTFYSLARERGKWVMTSSGRVLFSGGEGYLVELFGEGVVIFPRERALAFSDWAYYDIFRGECGLFQREELNFSRMRKY